MVLKKSLMIITRNRVYFDTEMDNYRERYKRIGESDWFKEHYAGKSLGEVMDDLSDPSKLREAIDETEMEDIIKNQKPIPPEIAKLVDENFWNLMNGDGTLMASQEPTNSITDKSPRYTKWEIENRLYSIIDNETIFPPGEDMGSAYKLLNKFLEGL